MLNSNPLSLINNVVLPEWLESYNHYSGYRGSMSETTTIQIKKGTRDALRFIDHMGEDYNTVIEEHIRIIHQKFIVQNFQYYTMTKNDLLD